MDPDCREPVRRPHDEVESLGLLVDAKPASIEFYLPFGFVRVEAIAGIAQTTPRPIALYLHLGAVPRRVR